MVASWAACVNRAQGAVRRLCPAHFDHSRRSAGVDVCIYCDVRFATDFSPRIRGLVDPWGGVAESWSVVGGEESNFGELATFRQRSRRPRNLKAVVDLRRTCSETARVISLTRP